MVLLYRTDLKSVTNFIAVNFSVIDLSAVDSGLAMRLIGPLHGYMTVNRTV